ncbi:MAG: hypothetical protein EBX52_03550 [Proteobacteria bacterium]|nr:hypothetical protein [Pseudomonadota bacterium]
MPSFHEFQTTIQSRNQREIPPTVGTLIRIEFDRKDRSRNALRTTGLFLALAAGAVLIPFWHFILVPSFFTLAWIMGMEKFSEKSRSAGGRGQCPHCQKEFKIGKSAWKEMMTDTCESCFQELEITPRTADR